MIIADVSALLFWGVLIFCIFIVSGVTYFLTRCWSLPYDYQKPFCSWDYASNGTLSATHACIDYRGNDKTIAMFRADSLSSKVAYIRYWNVCLSVPIDDCLLVQPNGAFLSLDSGTTDRWTTQLVQGQDVMPRVMMSSTTIGNSILDGVDRAHHYQRLLAVKNDDAMLVICRLSDKDPATRPWLLIYINPKNKRHQLQLATEGEVAEAARLAVLAMWSKALKPDGELWEQAEEL